LVGLYRQQQSVVVQALDTERIQVGMDQAVVLAAAEVVMMDRHTRLTVERLLLVKEMQEELGIQALTLWEAEAAVLVQLETTP
jgi:hypothetical protein